MKRAQGTIASLRAEEPAPLPMLPARIVERLRLLCERRSLWLQHAAEHVDDDEPRAEARFYLEAGEGRLSEIREALAENETILRGALGAALRSLSETFSLRAGEVDILLSCAALAFEPSLGERFAALQGRSSRSYVSETLVARLFGHGYRSLFSESSQLAFWRLVTRAEAPPGEPPPLVLDPLVLRVLQGELSVDASLVGRVHEIAEQPALEGWPLLESAKHLRAYLQAGQGLRVHIVGRPGSGRRTFARALCAALGQRALAFDCSGVEETAFEDLCIRAQRLALLSRACLVWQGDRLTRPWPLHASPAPLHFVVREASSKIAPHPILIDYAIELPELSSHERHMLWQRHWPAFASFSESARATLTRLRSLGPAEIATIARHRPGDASRALALARRFASSELGELGEVVRAEFRWEDLVLPDKLREALIDFSYECKERASFFERPQARRLFPRGTGMTALFSGAPGTGKTMAAQVIAAELGVELVRVDLATLVSKYIGETAKNLKQVFERAARSDVVLLFDEADALFTSRTKVQDAHDRYANADTNYLLQLLEEQRGVVILASNKKGNIDAAFMRRMRFVLEFPRPEATVRQQLWERVVESCAGEAQRAALQPLLEVAAEVVDLSGAQIKQAFLGAWFSAKRQGEASELPRLDAEALLRGIERELAKEGRSLSAREKERWLRHV